MVEKNLSINVAHFTWFEFIPSLTLLLENSYKLWFPYIYGEMLFFKLFIINERKVFYFMLYLILYLR